MDEDDIESILFMCREVMVYKVPPRTSNAGYRAMEWGDLAQHLWKGRMRIIESAKTCAIRLEDSSTGDGMCTKSAFGLRPITKHETLNEYFLTVFAQAPYDATGISVEPVLDSSRYFVLRVEDAGKKAYIGVGFMERSDSFDFNVALQDYTKRQKALLNPQTNASDPTNVSPHIPTGARKDYSLKDGQTLGSISIPGGGSKKKDQGGLLLGGGKPAFGGSGVPLLPPPPSASKKRN